MAAEGRRWQSLSGDRIRRLVEAPRRQRKNLDAVLSHPNRMLELGRQGPVPRDRGPAIGQDFHVRPAEVDHRLDRENHARLEDDSLAQAADVDDVRLIVKKLAKAVTAEIAYHGHVL